MKRIKRETFVEERGGGWCSPAVSCFNPAFPPILFIRARSASSACHSYSSTPGRFLLLLDGLLHRLRGLLRPALLLAEDRLVPVPELVVLGHPHPNDAHGRASR